MSKKLKEILKKGTKEINKNTVMLAGVLVVGVMLATSSCSKIGPGDAAQTQADNISRPLNQTDGLSGQGGSKSGKESACNDADCFEQKTEERLEGILAHMADVGAVQVMITVESTHENVLAKNTSYTTSNTQEEDHGGGTRVAKQEDDKKDIVLQNGNVPYVLKENAPQIKGVLVLAENGDKIEVQNAIMHAVSSVLDIPPHKISIQRLCERQIQANVANE